MPEAYHHKQYEKSLESLSIGIPIYHPADDLTPGSCGYFDERGKWVKLLDIPSISSTDSEYKTMPPQSPSTNGPRQLWGPVYGKTVRCCGMDADVKIEPPNMPATAGINMNFEKSAKYGAILLTEPVKLRSFVHSQPFDDWCKSNGLAIIQNKKYGDAVKKYGLFIITQAYTTPHCSIISWSGSNNNVKIEMSAEAFNAAKLTGKGFWRLATDTGVFRDFPHKGAKGEYAVFIGGLEYKFSWLKSKFKPQEPFREERKRGRDDDSTFEVSASDGYYSVERCTKSLAVPTAIPQPLEDDLRNP